MSAQLSLFGAEAPVTDGLFLALFPEIHAQIRINGIARQLRDEHGLKGKLLEANRYHVSLFSFGEYSGLPPRLAPDVVKAATAVEMSPFDVMFDRVMSFSSNAKRRPLVLGGAEGLARLIAFQKALAAVMQKAGLARAKQQFTPHVTLLYDERGVEEQPTERIGWTVTEFALVHSLLGRGQYDILGRWPLRADGVRLH